MSHIINNYHKCITMFANIGIIIELTKSHYISSIWILITSNAHVKSTFIALLCDQIWYIVLTADVYTTCFSLSRQLIHIIFIIIDNINILLFWNVGFCDFIINNMYNNNVNSWCYEIKIKIENIARIFWVNKWKIK